MAILAVALCLLIAALGGLGVIAPERLLDTVRRFQSPAGLYAAAAIRVVLGAALFLAADTSRSPEVIRGLGIFVFVAGLVTPFFGVERYRALLDWWSARGEVFVRAWAAFAVAFGLGLAYLVLP
jgi:hypothetical protein